MINSNIKQKQNIIQMPSPSYNGDLQFRFERELIIMLLGDEKGVKRERILNHLNANMFVHKFFRNIFEVITFLAEQKKEINLYEVMSYVNADNKDLEDLYKEYTTCVNCDYYIEKLQDAYINRSVENATSLDELQSIQEEKDKYALKDDMINASICGSELLKQYNTCSNEVIISYPSIAKYIRTLKAGNIMVLAGGTSMGKTQFTLNLVNRLQSEYKISFYSLEMSRTELVDRLIAMNTGLDCGKIRNHCLDAQEYMQYKEYIENELPKLNLKICDKKDITTNYIQSLEKNSDSDLVVIDYLGLVTPNIRCKKYEAVTELSRSFKILAGVIKKPILLLHQINRSYMDRQDKRPLLTDLRDSGAIEQDADFVCFVHRPYVVGDAQMDDHIEFIIRKNRFGTTNVAVSMLYNGSTQKITDFKDVAPDYEF